MTTFEDVLDYAKFLMAKEGMTPIERALKLSEEAGEVSQSVLSALGVSYHGRKGLDADDVVDECADVIICAMVLMATFKPDVSNEELAQVAINKILAWKTKLKKEGLL